MKDFFRGKVVTIIIVVATVILAGIAIFTALRLYQLRQQSVAPTAPESRPAANEQIACEVLAFTISTPTPSLTPTDGPTPSASPSPTLTPTPPTTTVTTTPTDTPTTTTPGPADTSTPTEAPELPPAGVSYPTIIGISAGVEIVKAKTSQAICSFAAGLLSGAVGATDCCLS